LKNSSLLLLGATTAPGLLWTAESGALEQGQSAFRLRNWAAAEQAFSRAAADQPNDATPPKWLGMTYAAQEKFLLAEAPFQHACRLAPRDPDACYYWGRTLFSLGRFEPALAP
jgi:Flp pilus assembly protein TadD